VPKFGSEKFVKGWWKNILGETQDASDVIFWERFLGDFLGFGSGSEFPEIANPKKFGKFAGGIWPFLKNCEGRRIPSQDFLVKNQKFVGWGGVRAQILAPPNSPQN
jgi:hypothetical protein